MLKKRKVTPLSAGKAGAREHTRQCSSQPLSDDAFNHASETTGEVGGR
jgi:hypothetical protein